MTTGYAAHGQIAPVRKAVVLDGFHGVVRAGGVEAAMWADERADQVLIDLDQPDQDSTHVDFLMVVQARASVSKSRGFGTAKTPREQRMTMSTPGSV